MDVFQAIFKLPVGGLYGMTFYSKEEAQAYAKKHNLKIHSIVWFSQENWDELRKEV